MRDLCAYYDYLAGICLTSLPQFEHEWSSKDFLKCGQVFLHAPDFDLAVMRCVDMQRYVLRIDHAQACALDEASMATIQILCQAEQGTRDVHNLLGTLIQSGEFRIFFARQSLAMVQCRRRHNGNFCLIKAEEVGMFDEVVGMCLVIGICQKRPNMMQ